MSFVHTALKTKAGICFIQVGMTFREAGWVGRQERKKGFMFVSKIGENSAQLSFPLIGKKK